MSAPDPDEKNLVYLSVLNLSELERDILRFIALFPTRHRFPSLPRDIEIVFQIDHDKAMRILNNFNSLGYVEFLEFRGQLRGVVCSSLY